ncbi:MAG: hypothetical protein D6696_00920 [Acidobacteria bacterium]|nr:MAG: hypothetical protein D6696_00920 [Acidobacteriota bacterium]
MKSKLVYLALAALTVAAVTISITFTPEANALNGCLCVQAQSTTVMTGNGVGCSAAQADLFAATSAAAGCDSFCSRSLVITKPCYNNEPNNPTWKKVDGYLRYQCEICPDERI